MFDLKSRRAAALAGLRAIVDRAKAGNRDLTFAELAQVNEKIDEVKDLGGKIFNLESVGGCDRPAAGP